MCKGPEVEMSWECLRNRKLNRAAVVWWVRAKGMGGTHFKIFLYILPMIVSYSFRPGVTTGLT